MLSSEINLKIYADINNSTLLSDYILKAKSYNMFKNNILYLPIL